VVVVVVRGELVDKALMLMVQNMQPVLNGRIERVPVLRDILTLLIEPHCQGQAQQEEEQEISQH